jgi:hypothetical protein
VTYGAGTTTFAKIDADYFMPVTYPEHIEECELKQMAPDLSTTMRNLANAFPSPEGFEGDSLELPSPLLIRRA